MALEMLEPTSDQVDPNQEKSLEEIASMIESHPDHARQEPESQEVPAQIDQQPQVTEPEQKPAQADQPHQDAPQDKEPEQPKPDGQAKPDQQADDYANIEDLMRKKGLKSIDDVYKLYSGLERKLHDQAQENSFLRQEVIRQQSAPTQQPQQQPSRPQMNNNDVNVWLSEGIKFDENGVFVGDLASRILALNHISNRPLIINQQDSNFRSELTRLSSSPKTADFNLPEVQDEMQKVIQERSQDYLDPFTGKLKAEKLEDVYYLARGRLGNINTAAHQQQPQISKPQAPVEGKNKFRPAQTFDFNKATAKELEEYINSIAPPQREDY